MSRPPVTYPASLRPTLVDFVLLMGGLCLSLYLMDLAPIAAEAHESETAPEVRMVVAFLPRALRLGEGLFLLWPLFYCTQLFRGRRQALTGPEWLWVVNWLGIALLSTLAVTDSLGTTPDLLKGWSGTLRRGWYLVFVPPMAVLAVILTAARLIRKSPPPWTHSLGLALILWQAAPLAGILTLGQFVVEKAP
jgi:hypothetical protein